MTAMMFALATVNPEAKEKAAEYSEGVKPLLGQYGGKPVGRYPISAQLVGEHAANVLLQVEFPATADVMTFLDSPEYRALIPLREAGFASMQIYVSEA
ncbi:MAG: hypothetical protein CMI09_08845 [Oceanospirillaceae bacterium]|nr:hypothetical protein [Oceanospirillaceae bacterium]